MTTRTLKLGKTPDRSRLQSLSAGSVPAKSDRLGGKFGAGVLASVSAITRGEALGHGYWIDDVFLQQVAESLASATDGSKCRFTHPGLSADGLAKTLGLAFGGKVAGDQVLTDLHFYESAHKSPDGDLAGYVMDRADEDPKKFGTSIVFLSDFAAEKDFMLANGGVVVVHDDGWETYETIEGFVSPDPLNTENLPHVRMKKFMAVDVVDDPAANPNGLFHRDLSTVSTAESFLDYALGLSQTKPTGMAFDVDPERARLFFQRYAAQRNFNLPKKGNPMTVPTPANTEAPVETAPECSVTCPDCGAVFVPGQKNPEPISEVPQTPAQYAANHKRYVDAFGAENGSKWFLSGMKFHAAQHQHFTAQLAAKDQQIVQLQSQLKDANERLAAVAKDGANALGASPPPAGTEGKRAVSFASIFQPASGA